MIERFRLFANCIPVRGARRSSLCDLQRHRLHLIPNALFDILTIHRDKTLDELCGIYGADGRSTLTDYFALLTQEEWGVWTQWPERFPDLDLTYSAPGLVDAALIDADAESQHDYESIVRQLDDVGCRWLHVRCYASAEVMKIDALLAAIAASGLRGVELTLRYSTGRTSDTVCGWCARDQRINGVLIHGAPDAHLEWAPDTNIPIRYIERIIASPEQCGWVHPAYFAINVRAFAESLAFNSCLNRKVSVTARGLICNCPAMGSTFGSVNDQPIRSRIELPQFRASWAIRKDDIAICRDCEFRYVCPDCRAHRTDPADLYSKPATCTYDPYTAQWGVAQ
jgi:SPASM domain peptide maturase of grasp-with-spasm system